MSSNRRSQLSEFIRFAFCVDLMVVSSGWCGNAVIQAPYVDLVRDIFPDEIGDKAVEKAQYEPMTPEKPILYKKALDQEITAGAQYPSGEEVVIDPAFPNWDTNQIPIVEQSSN